MRLTFIIPVVASFIFFTIGYTTVDAATCIKSMGDADCNGTINISDFETWRKEFTGAITSKNTDFDNSGTVDIGDFEIWRKCYTNSGCSASSPVPSSKPSVISPTNKITSTTNPTATIRPVTPTPTSVIKNTPTPTLMITNTPTPTSQTGTQQPASSSCDHTVFPHAYGFGRRLHVQNECRRIQGKVVRRINSHDGDYNLDILIDTSYRQFVGNVSEIHAETICHHSTTDTGPLASCKGYTNKLHPETMQVGDHVEIIGPYVKDGTHGMRDEIHPVLSIKKL